MPGGFSNKPKILRGAFVEYGSSIPRLTVVFQFNPTKLTRDHSLTYNPPNVSEKTTDFLTQGESKTPQNPLRKFHLETDDLFKIQEEQAVTVQEETIKFDIRLDASDKLNIAYPDYIYPFHTSFGILFAFKVQFLRDQLQV